MSTNQEGNSNNRMADEVPGSPVDHPSAQSASSPSHESPKNRTLSDELVRQLDELADNARNYSDQQHEGQLINTAAITTIPRLRDIVLPIYKDPFACFRRFFTRQHRHQERQPLLPVYHVGPSSPNPYAGNSLVLVIPRWILDYLRRQYPNPLMFLFAFLITTVLIIALLALFFTGNLRILIMLTKELICQIIGGLQSANMPSFCH